jgi:hypothetical protein
MVLIACWSATGIVATIAANSAPVEFGFSIIGSFFLEDAASTFRQPFEIYAVLLGELADLMVFEF